ncbi:MAG: hypothetical protein KM310_00205 [Clostridiales bacterium]|nr:hypothetical protein [Clostridiales bacterium]
MMDPLDYLDTTRYNGGWIKHVTGLDKTKRNGYSILGQFMRHGKDLYIVGGLYLDCGIGGSRRRHRKHYTLFRVVAADKIEILATVGDAPDWAINLWPAIEEALASEPADNPLAVFTTEELMAELKRRGAL